MYLGEFKKVVKTSLTFFLSFAHFENIMLEYNVGKISA